MAIHPTGIVIKSVSTMRWNSWLTVTGSILSCVVLFQPAVQAAEPIKSAEPTTGSESWVLDLEIFDGYAESPRHLTREEFVIAMVAFGDDHLLELYDNEAAVKESYCGIQVNAINYLVERSEYVQQQAQQLIIETRNALAKQQKASPPVAAKQQTNGISLPGDFDATASYASSLMFLQEELKIDFRLADGSLRADAPLTQGDFIKYLSQGLHDDLLDTVLPLSRGDGNSYTASELGDRMARISDRLATINQVIQRLEFSIEETALDKRYSPRIDQPAPQQLAKIYSVSEVVDVTPEDDVYAPLRRMIEEYGVDVTQADGFFNGSDFLTRGDFIVYLHEFTSLFLIPNVIPDCFFFEVETQLGRLQGQEFLLEELEFELRTLITQVNQSRSR